MRTEEGRGESMKDTNLSPGDLHDYEPPIYCRDCKNFDLESNVCMLDDEAEVVSPDKSLEFCVEYEERESYGQKL